jgi:hypothetical protein
VAWFGSATVLFGLSSRKQNGKMMGMSIMSSLEMPANYQENGKARWKYHKLFYMEKGTSNF